MARMGRGFGRGFGRGGRGIGGRRHLGFGGRRRGGKGSDLLTEYERMMDRICYNTLPPLLYNGMLTIAGRDTSVIANLDNFNLETT